MDALTCDRRIHGVGTAPTSWTPWLKELAPDAKSIFASSRVDRLVVLAPHPDDEILMCGGLLESSAARGREVLVIAATDGEASHPGEIEPASLGAMRRGESLAGLDALGIAASQTLRLGLPDGGLGARVRELTALVQRELRPHDVVVTTWRWDGHPDHEASGLAAVRACASVGCQLLEAPVWMWHWAHPGDERVPWQRLRGHRMAAGAVRTKQQALEQHHSQIECRANGAEPILGSNILERAAWSTEYFFV
jgi:LmbE family N-acetylglucosaminyl deacetylase